MNSKINKVIIDCEQLPYIPEGFTIAPDSQQLPHRVQGMFSLSMEQIHLYTYRNWRPGQREQKKRITYFDNIKDELKEKRVFTAHVLDYLIKEESKTFIPIKWKKLRIIFWGTIYLDYLGRPRVRVLEWASHQRWWQSYSRFLIDYIREDMPAAVAG